MTTSIVVGTDGSLTATHAVWRAAELARADGARLHIVTAYDPSIRAADRRALETMPHEPGWRASPGEAAERVGRDAAEMVAETGVVADVYALPGDPVDALVSVAETTGADLLVVGNRGMAGMAGFVRPSVPNRISHRAKCDVLIVNTSGSAA